VLLVRGSLCLCPPRQNSGISNTKASREILQAPARKTTRPYPALYCLKHKDHGACARKQRHHHEAHELAVLIMCFLYPQELYQRHPITCGATPPSLSPQRTVSSSYPASHDRLVRYPAHPQNEPHRKEARPAMPPPSQSLAKIPRSHRGACHTPTAASSAQLAVSRLPAASSSSVCIK